ncbi:CTP synthase (glutamine hydrolyzing) [Candidatus Woesearchaeota archaeon]|nr:CTP synthase (glutamine hydrolyzing) [Candidatus Woesearchaeota archaeon]
MPKNTKWIVISGGVLSGLGKGIVTASIGRLLSNNYKVTPIKCDGYLNIDPGTMNPFEHGEVFVLEDGGEVDMDFGHYERFMNMDCQFGWNLTSGKIFQSVINKERRGDYLGQTVQIVPHVVNEVKLKMVEIVSKENSDVALVEIGGTVGDIENQIFYEAVRQLKMEVGRQNMMNIHVTYVPVLETVGEQKTKPTQQSTRFLQNSGIQPDVIIGRSQKPLTNKSKQKIAMFCNLDESEVLSSPDIRSVYELPLIFEKERLNRIIEAKLGLAKLTPLKKWRRLVNNINFPKKEIEVAICGKYTELHDSYVSIHEALVHAGAHHNARVHLKWIETTALNSNPDLIKQNLNNVDGVIIPGGFGARGAEGKIEVIRYLRKNNVPFLGLCYGLQLAVVEFARNVCRLDNANSTEIDDKTQHPVVYILPEQRSVNEKGGTMRLGSCQAVLRKKSIVHQLYKVDCVNERHRHRYEVNPLYHAILQSNGLVFSGMSPNRRLVEFIELPKHKFFVGTQGHPELKSRLERPAPLFYGFVGACLS